MSAVAILRSSPSSLKENHRPSPSAHYRRRRYSNNTMTTAAATADDVLCNKKTNKGERKEEQDRGGWPATSAAAAPPPSSTATEAADEWCDFAPFDPFVHDSSKGNNSSASSGGAALQRLGPPGKIIAQQQQQVPRKKHPLAATTASTQHPHRCRSSSSTSCTREVHFHVDESTGKIANNLYYEPPPSRNDDDDDDSTAAEAVEEDRRDSPEPIQHKQKQQQQPRRRSSSRRKSGSSSSSWYSGSEFARFRCEAHGAAAAALRNPEYIRCMCDLYRVAQQQADDSSKGRDGEHPNGNHVNITMLTPAMEELLLDAIEHGDAYRGLERIIFRRELLTDKVAAIQGVLWTQEDSDLNLLLSDGDRRSVLRRAAQRLSAPAALMAHALACVDRAAVLDQQDSARRPTAAIRTATTAVIPTENGRYMVEI
jgi:hypothetical protein